MESKLIIQIVTLIFLNQLAYSQEYDKFLDAYYFNKLHRTEKTADYNDVEGSPYLFSDFLPAELYLKDTTAFRLLLRYNIYLDAMEYRVDETNYMIDNPHFLKKIVLNGATFVYLPFIEKGGYFELLISGKCFLIQKRVVKYKPAEGPKPIEGIIIPAKFIKGKDKFYLLMNATNTYEILNLKSVITTFQDKKVQIEQYIKNEKIKNIKKENLIKISEYYNSL